MESIPRSSTDMLEDAGIYPEKISPEAWDDIVGMTNEKQLIDSTIVLPLQHPDIAMKHGVIPPKAILLFGPPGTGKTFFARGIAGRLGWSFIEVSPSILLIEGMDKQSLKLKELSERLLRVSRTVIFFDEFEQLALRPDTASEREKLVSSEMLRQIPRFRSDKELLLIFATNNVRLLNPALLRPGRLDYILPVGPANVESRKAIFRRYLNRMNTDKVDLDLIARQARYYTPADIQDICSQTAQKAFEKEVNDGVEHKVQNNDLLQAIENHRPTTTVEQIEEFKEDIRRFCRADYCTRLIEPAE